MAFKLSELNGKLGEVIEKLAFDRPMTIKERGNGTYQIWVSCDCLYITDMNLYVVPGLIKFLQPSKEIFEGDTPICYVFDADGNELHFSVDKSMADTMYSYGLFSGIDKSIISNLDCVYQFNNGNFLHQKVIHNEYFEITGEIDI